MAKKKSAKATKLTPKQERFCQEYVIDLNGTQAAIRAGYSEKTARQIASEYLTKPNIVAFIGELQKKVADKLEITQERVLKELARIGFGDVRQLFDEKGGLKDITKLTDDAASILSSVEVLEEFQGHGEDREQIGFTKKVKLWDKVSALEKLGKHLGIFEKDNVQQGTKISVRLNK